MASELFSFSSRTLVSGEKSLKLSRPILMGILNSTPDSFSDGSSFFEFDDALVQARKIISCLLYTSPSPRDGLLSRMPSSA